MSKAMQVSNHSHTPTTVSMTTSAAFTSTSCALEIRLMNNKNHSPQLMSIFTSFQPHHDLAMSLKLFSSEKQQREAFIKQHAIENVKLVIELWRGIIIRVILMLHTPLGATLIMVIKTTGHLMKITNLQDLRTSSIDVRLLKFSS
jgi:hypothetical protein